MIKVSKDFYIKVLLSIIVIFANITGIIQLIGGSIIAEGSIIILTILMTFILLLKKRQYDIIDFAMIFIAIYSIIISLINVVYFDVESSSLIGIYYYTLPCLILLCKDCSFFKKNVNFIYSLLLFMLFINSLYAIYQFLGPNPIIPLDRNRATGLMKTTLNYSGIIGATFYPLLFFIKKNNIIYKKILFFIIIIGAIFSQSRGLFANIILGFSLAPISTIIINKKINYKNILKFIFIVTFIILLFLIIYSFIQDCEFIKRISRLFHIFDYKTDKANTLRILSWSSFIDYFVNKPMGYGVGQIASGTSFVSNAITFESYILNTIYSIGIVGILYFYVPIYWVYKKLKKVQDNLQKYMHMFIIGILIQNAVQPSMLTPTTLIITWLNFILFTNLITIENNKRRIL